MPQANAPRMPLIPALEVLRDLRGERIVVSNMGTAREWPKLSRHPLDFHFVPSAMGHAPMLALGVALAKRERDVLCFTGDGGLLMSLGCLVTAAAARAKNLTVVLIDNGIYEVTGGQATAAAGAAVDWVLVARGCGLAHAAEFCELEVWKAQAEMTLALPGPKLIALRVAPVGADYHLEPPGPIVERIKAFREALAAI